MKIRVRALCALLAGVPVVASAGSLDTWAANGLARELVTASTPLQLTEANGHAWDITARLGYALSSNETRNIRIDCSNLVFDAGKLGVAYSNGTVGAPAVVDNGGGGAGAGLVFSISAGAAGATSDTFTVHPLTAGAMTLRSLGEVQCSYRLYQFPADALAGNAQGVLQNTGMRPFLQVTDAVAMTVQAGTLVTAFNGPSPGPAYSQFKSGVLPASVPGTWRGIIGTVDFAVKNDLYQLDGQAVTAAAIYTTGTKIQLHGVVGTVTGFQVRLGKTSYCVPAFATLDMPTRSFLLSAPPSGSYNLCYWVPGSEGIPDAEWQLSLKAPNGATLAPQAAGTIRKEGIELQASIAGFHENYVNRIVVANDSGTDVSYRIRVLSDDGNAIGTDSALATGTFKTGRSTTIELQRLLTSASVAPRATVILAVDTGQAGADAIKAMLAGTAFHKVSGAVSNAQMVRMGPGGSAF